jgi:hypothetical protein
LVNTTELRRAVASPTPRPVSSACLSQLTTPVPTSGIVHPDHALTFDDGAVEDREAACLNRRRLQQHITYKPGMKYWLKNKEGEQSMWIRLLKR